MQPTLKHKTYEAIRELWPKSNGRLRSETIYQWLIDNGVSVPEGKLDKIFTDLEKRGRIKSDEGMGAESIKKHGQRRITWVHPTVLW